MTKLLFAFGISFLTMSQAFGNICEDQIYQEMHKKKGISKAEHYKLINNDPAYNYLVKNTFQMCEHKIVWDTLKSTQFKNLCPNSSSSKKRLPCVKDFIAKVKIDTSAQLSNILLLVTTASVLDKTNFPTEAIENKIQLLENFIGVLESVKFNQFYVFNFKNNPELIEIEKKLLTNSKPRLISRLEEMLGKIDADFKRMPASNKSSLVNLKAKVQKLKDKDWIK